MRTPQLGDRYGASREYHIVVPTMEKPSDSMARLYILKGMAGGGGGIIAIPACSNPSQSRAVFLSVDSALPHLWWV